MSDIYHRTCLHTGLPNRPGWWYSHALCRWKGPTIELHLFIGLLSCFLHSMSPDQIGLKRSPEVARLLSALRRRPHPRRGFKHVSWDMGERRADAERGPPTLLRSLRSRQIYERQDGEMDIGRAAERGQQDVSVGRVCQESSTKNKQAVAKVESKRANDGEHQKAINGGVQEAKEKDVSGKELLDTTVCDELMRSMEELLQALSDAEAMATD